MAEKKPSEPSPTERQIKKDFRSDFERVLGVDDETLKQKQQPPSGSPSTAPAAASPDKPGGGAPGTANKRTGRKGCRSAMLVAIVVTLVVAIGAYFFTGDQSTLRRARRDSGRRVGVEAAGFSGRWHDEARGAGTSKGQALAHHPE